MTGLLLSFSPRIFLLCDFRNKKFMSKKDLLGNLVTAASMCMTKGWKICTPSSKEDWLSKVLFFNVKIVCSWKI